MLNAAAADGRGVDDLDWTELSAFLRRSFGEFLMRLQEATPAAVFRRCSNPRRDGSLTLVPFEDVRSRQRYVAHVSSSGAVSAEGIEHFEGLDAPVVQEINPADFELVRVEMLDVEPAAVEPPAGSPLPHPEAAAEAYARVKFDKSMQYDSCRRGYLTGYAAVPEDWRSSDPLPDAWDDPDFREMAFALDGLRGLRWIEAFERGFKKGAIDAARHMSTE
jgi:hypothetical protein